MIESVFVLVCRCGMIYMEPRQLGWEPLVTSWMQKEYPSNLSTASRSSIQVNSFFCFLACLLPLFPRIRVILDKEKA